SGQARRVSSRRVMLAVWHYRHSPEFTNAPVALRAKEGLAHVEIEAHAILECPRMRAIVTWNPFLCTGSANEKEVNHENNELDPRLSHSRSASHVWAGRSRGTRK